MIRRRMTAEVIGITPSPEFVPPTMSLDALEAEQHGGREVDDYRPHPYPLSLSSLAWGTPEQYMESVKALREHMPPYAPPRMWPQYGDRWDATEKPTTSYALVVAEENAALRARIAFLERTARPSMVLRPPPLDLQPPQYDVIGGPGLVGSLWFALKRILRALW